MQIGSLGCFIFHFPLAWASVSISSQHTRGDPGPSIVINTALRLTAVLLPITSSLAYLVNREVPDPYLVSPVLIPVPHTLQLTLVRQDETFHIPQAQQYCRGDFVKWVASITTPPRL